LKFIHQQFVPVPGIFYRLCRENGSKGTKKHTFIIFAIQAGSGVLVSAIHPVEIK